MYTLPNQLQLLNAKRHNTRVHTDPDKYWNLKFKFSGPQKSLNQAQVVENQPKGCCIFDPCTPKPNWQPGSA